MNVKRTRSMSNEEPTFLHKVSDYYPANGDPIVKTEITIPANFAGESKTMSDENHPGYKRAIARNVIVMGDMSLVRRERSYTPGNIAWWDNTARVATYYDGDFVYAGEGFGSMSPISSNDISSIGQIALAKAYAKMNEPNLLSGEFLSDISKTMGMLRRPFQGFQTLVDKVHKRKIRNLGRLRREVAKADADAWLEYRYGWKPLMMDTEEIYGMVGQKMATYNQHLVARASESYELARAKEFVDATIWDSPFWRISGQALNEHSVRASAGVMYDVDCRTTARGMASRLGTRLSDVPATVWEIVPYSFVVDWFVNVGSWIQAVTPVPGITVRGSWLTTVEKLTQTTLASEIKCIGLAYPSGDAKGPGGSSSVKTERVTRTAFPILGSTPVMRVRNPSLIQTADGLSLSLSSIMGSLRRLKH